jgi:hypothetical protein
MAAGCAASPPSDPGTTRWDARTLQSTCASITWLLAAPSTRRPMERRMGHHIGTMGHFALPEQRGSRHCQRALKVGLKRPTGPRRHAGVDSVGIHWTGDTEKGHLPSTYRRGRGNNDVSTLVAKAQGQEAAHPIPVAPHAVHANAPLQRTDAHVTQCAPPCSAETDC